MNKFYSWVAVGFTTVALLLVSSTSAPAATPYLPIECNFEKGYEYQYHVVSAVQNTPIIRAWLYQGTNWYAPTNANQYRFMFGRNEDTAGMVIITGVVSSANFRNTNRACVDFPVTTNKFTQPVQKYYSVVLETNSSSKISFCHGYITIGKSPEINAYSALPYSKPIDGSLFGPFSGSFSGWPFMGSSHPAYNITVFDTQTWWAASGGGGFVIQQQLIDASNNLVAMFPTTNNLAGKTYVDASTNLLRNEIIPLIPAAINTNDVIQKSTNDAITAIIPLIPSVVGFVTASITNGLESIAGSIAKTNLLRGDIADGFDYSTAPTVNGNALLTNATAAAESDPVYTTGLTARLTGILGTAAYSNGTAFYPAGNPSGFIAPSYLETITNEYATTNRFFLKEYPGPSYEINIGYLNVGNTGTINIGYGAQANEPHSIAIGEGATCFGKNQIAIGHGAPELGGSMTNEFVCYLEADRIILRGNKTIMNTLPDEVILTSNRITQTAFTPTPKAWAISNLIDYTILSQSYYPTNIGTNYLAAFSPTNGGCTFRFDIANGSNTSWNTNNIRWSIGTVTNGTLIFDWSTYLQKWRVGLLYGESL